MTAQTNSSPVNYPIINVSEPEYCQLEIHYEADRQVVKEKVNEAIAQLRKLPVPGFRPGKATDNAIKIRLRPQINNYVAREMASHAIDDIVFETNIKPLGAPEFSNMHLHNNHFSCDIKLMKKPEFQVGNFKFDVPKPHVNLDADLLAEKSLYNLRLRVGEVEPYEEADTVDVGDDVTMSFTATVEGEPFDGSSVEGKMYTVGSSQWNGWDQYIVGMKAGESREFDFVFENGDLSGKTAKFNVTIHMGTKRKPHPVNEDFCKMMGVENLEVLMAKLKEIAQSSSEHSYRKAIRDQVAIKLVENNIFDVPKKLVDEEAKYIVALAGGVFDNLSDEEKQSVRDQAEKNVKVTLILDTLRDSEPDSVLSDIEAQNYLAQHFQSQGQSLDVWYKNPQLRPQLATLLNNIKNEFTLQWVADQANIIE